VPFGDPVCSAWRNFVFGIAKEFCDKAGVKAFNGGTYVCMEGPLFSTRAESNFYRSIDASVIGMTSLPEAKLAREAELCYSAVSLVTDFDCWHVGEENVTADAVVAQMKRNIVVATNIVIAMLERLSAAPKCETCHNALAGGIMTAPHAIDAKLKADLWPLVGHRLPTGGH
jgi:5'-methylthioadenosine phosphorylase